MSDCHNCYVEESGCGDPECCGTSYVIKFCPLHRAAPRLLEALKARIDGYTDDEADEYRALIEDAEKL